MEELAHALAEQCATRRPIVVMDAPFDLTLLDRELRRHRASSLAGYLGDQTLCVLDPRVLDRHLDHDREGRRTLGDLCELYGVELDGARDAAADAAASLELVRAMGRRYSAGLEGLTPPELHSLQAQWHAAQVRGRRRGSRRAAPRRRWIRPGRCVRNCRRRPEGTRVRESRSVDDSDGPALPGWAILGSNQ